MKKYQKNQVIMNKFETVTLYINNNNLCINKI